MRISILMVIKNLPENLHQRLHFDQFWVAAGQEPIFEQIWLNSRGFRILIYPNSSIPDANSHNSSNPGAECFQFFEPSNEFLSLPRALASSLSPSPSLCPKLHQLIEFLGWFALERNNRTESETRTSSETLENCTKHEKIVRNTRRLSETREKLIEMQKIMLQTTVCR